ncbi:hypothetical protein [Streptomyces echinatus]|uniref:Glyoxalase n=1 Tax=Streptomyces echinatus TaxID=67293 RepID=A0A7W9Q210_9ACTN|nr:hypothetical protein [Streptomyces echinatus]MBB5932095.1 hypothetical protein [Streptomyces echinatus]
MPTAYACRPVVPESDGAEPAPTVPPSASAAAPHRRYAAAMQDPEGNEFDVV